MDVRKAISFVKEKGSDLERARLRHILYGSDPEPETVQPFLQLQSSAGGFPLGMRAGNPVLVDNTLTALWWLDELGMLNEPVSRKALEYLLVVQKEDGGWDEDPLIERDDLPPWVRPGDLSTRLYLTAYAAYWLIAGGYGSQPALKKSVAFLLQHQKETGRFSGYLHTTWIAASVCWISGYQEAARAGLQALLEWPLADWEDSQSAWALDCFYRAGLPRDHLLVDRLLVKLMSSQAPKGQWASEDGEPYSVSATLEVLKAFKHYGELPEIPGSFL